MRPCELESLLRCTYELQKLLVNISDLLVDVTDFYVSEKSADR